MFTGIIEETGTIESFEHLQNGARIVVMAKSVLTGAKIGDSIAINGVCETVTELGQNYFCATVSNETLNITNFNTLKIGDIVNLERALTLEKRLGGHIVSGHVDCVGIVKNIEKLSDFYDMEFEIEKEFAKFVVYKGSVTINGISLTIASIKSNIFRVAIIPHTFSNTNLFNLKIGDKVNIETDILAKYVEKLLSLNDNKKNNINIDFLKENGFV